MGYTESLAPAGWYADPSAPQMLRWWDGGAWTSHTTPLPPPPVTAPTVVRMSEPAESRPPAPVAATVDRDLAQNRPGAAVLAKAEETPRAAAGRGLLYRLLRSRREEKSWRAGALGEQIVAKRLMRLGPEWRVLHAVPVGTRGSDIDHVVIGPGGVFCLNSKNHSAGKVWISESLIMVNGQRTDYLRNSRHEADRASRLLTAACGEPIRVEPMIVLLMREATVKSLPRDVHVISARKVHRRLRRRPKVFTPSQVDAVYAVARRERTWQPGTA